MRTRLLVAVLLLFVGSVLSAQTSPSSIGFLPMNGAEARILEVQAKGYAYHTVLWQPMDRCLEIKAYGTEFLIDLDTHASTIAFRLSN